MKNTNKIVVLAMLCMLAVACHTAKKVQGPAYELPEAMKPEVKVEYAKLCDKGKILYDMNCAKCHNTETKHASLIPDFTQDQIRGYEIRVSNPKHEMSLLEEQITPEELGLISTFLMYKKKTGITMVKPAKADGAK